MSATDGSVDRSSGRISSSFRSRTKLAAALPEWGFIHTHFGFGYRFQPDVVKLAAKNPPQVLLDGFPARDRFVSADEIYQRATLAGLSIIASGVGE